MTAERSAARHLFACRPKLTIGSSIIFGSALGICGRRR
jgi:hypothetical protein